MKYVVLFFTLLFLGAAGYGVVEYYPYVFSKTIDGTFHSVERAGTSSVVGGTDGKTIAFSFAIAIKDQDTGLIVTASSEDRQWAVVKSGMCGQVKVFPYPPWDLEKGGTYHDARLLKLTDCK